MAFRFVLRSPCSNGERGPDFLRASFREGYCSVFRMNADGSDQTNLTPKNLDKIPWRGDERVLDVGCGRGLLAVGAAHRMSSGTVTGVDVWNRQAVSDNRAGSVLENAAIEGVQDRVA